MHRSGWLTAWVLRLALVGLFGLAASSGGCGLLHGLPTYQPDNPQDLAAYRKTLVELAAARSGMVVADIGSSYGYYLSALAPALGATGRYYATDIDPQAVRHLEEYRSRQPIVVPRLVRAPRDTALDDLAPESVDLVLMIDSIAFRRDGRPAEDLAFVKRLARLVKPGGRLIHHASWLTREEIGRDQDRVLFQGAGFRVCQDLPPPAPVPVEFRDPKGALLRRGFTLVYCK